MTTTLECMCKNIKFCVQLMLGGITQHPIHKTVLFTIHVNLHQLILGAGEGRREGKAIKQLR